MKKFRIITFFGSSNRSDGGWWNPKMKMGLLLSVSEIKSGNTIESTSTKIMVNNK